MKITGGIAVVAAIVVGAVALAFNCQAHGDMITLANGSKIPMKCYWTAIAEITIAAPLLIGGILLAISKTIEARRNLSLFGLVFGGLVMALPTALIGVCANPAHQCNMIMLPSLIALGALIVAGSAWTLYTTFRQPYGSTPRLGAAA